MYDENYLEFVKWMNKDENKHCKLPPLTRTQVIFATWMIKEHEHFNKIGNLLDVFIAVQKYIKTNPEYWVEHEVVESAIEVMPAADYSEYNQDEPFDWSTSMLSLERKYLSPFTKHKEPTRKPTYTFRDKILDTGWGQSFKSLQNNYNAVKETIEKYNESGGIVKTPDYIVWPKKKGEKCYLIGKVKDKIKGYNISVGAPVYYHELRDTYILLTAYDGVYMTYNPTSIRAFIEFNDKKPNGMPSIDNSIYISAMADQPFKNFHIEE